MAGKRDRKAYNAKWYETNKERLVDVRKTYRASNPPDPEVVRGYHLKGRYGLSVEAFDALLLAQDNKCAMADCRSSVPGGQGQWHVDHEHGTNRVRGLLCSSCNLALGHYEKRKSRHNTFENYLWPTP